MIVLKFDIIDARKMLLLYSTSIENKMICTASPKSQTSKHYNRDRDDSQMTFFIPVPHDVFQT